MDYIYRASIFFDTTNVIGVNVSTEAANTTDFETNYKSSCVEVNELQLLTNSFIIYKTYTEFKALITAEIDWTDVKLIIRDKDYCLYLITEDPL